MSRPFIGITAGEIYNREHPWSPVTNGQSHTYVASIQAAGGTPVILPLADDEEIIEDLYSRLDGILFSGGNDLDPRMYDAEVSEKTEDVSTFRDAFERHLITRALNDRKPMLAICRGMQLLNVTRGGSLYQDLPTELPHTQDHRKSTKQQDVESLAHVLRIAPESKLAHILQTTEIPTNTHHHQAVKELGDGLVATAWAEDNVVEGIELLGDAFVVAVQSHPESLIGVEPRWLRLFEAFVNAAKT